MLRASDIATTNRTVSRQEAYKERRAVAARAQARQAAGHAVSDEARVTALQATAALMLGGHIMEGVVDLDLHRRHLAKEDITLNMLLAEIEAETVQQVKRIQRSLFNDWAG